MLITQTPIRISFFGGGTDMREFYSRSPGAVLSTAIDKYLYVIVKERFDRQLILAWTIKEIVRSPDEIQHQLVREALRLTGTGPGIEIITTADIPSEGSGLGSSSALTVGLLNAFWQHRGEMKSATELAEQAARIEIDILKKPIGKQDHYAAACGHLRHITFFPDETVKAETLDVTETVRRQLESSLLMFYTNRTRPAEAILSHQQRRTDSNLSVLARMREQVDRAREYLIAGKLDDFGGLLHEGWNLKKRLAEGISDPEIDTLYDAGRRAGALGGKILGAGGGGFFLFYCPADRQEALRSAMRSNGLPEMPFKFERDGTKAIFNIRRDTWKVLS